MDEYISRKALFEDINRIGGHALCEWDTLGVRALVTRQPAADVTEVRHAYWKDNQNGTFTCSACGGKASKMNWCGHCGAKMDEKEDSE